MNNYYTDCIKTIQSHIEECEYELALEKLYVELSMPYIPEEYKQVFEEMLRTIQVETSKETFLLNDIEEIKEAFLKQGPYSTRALNSLEKLNLRPYIEDVKEILAYEIDDLIKRMILLLLLEQEVKLTVDVTLDDKKMTINTESLENPLDNLQYQKIFIELHETLESIDPSFLKLCLDELNMQMIQSFPKINENLSSEEIIKNVNLYLNKG